MRSADDVVAFQRWFGPDNGGAARRFTLMTWVVCFLNNFWKEIFKLPRYGERTLNKGVDGSASE